MAPENLEIRVNFSPEQIARIRRMFNEAELSVVRSSLWIEGESRLARWWRLTKIKLRLLWIMR